MCHLTLGQLLASARDQSVRQSISRSPSIGYLIHLSPSDSRPQLLSSLMHYRCIPLIVCLIVVSSFHNATLAFIVAPLRHNCPTLPLFFACSASRWFVRVGQSAGSSCTSIVIDTISGIRSSFSPMRWIYCRLLTLSYD